MNWTNIAIQIVMAAVASAGFAVFYRTPKSEYFFCGIGGAVCWGVYILSQHFGAKETIAVFLAAVVVSIVARFFAGKRRMPVTVFLAASIFPLVPGSYIYYTVYYLLNGESELSRLNFARTFTTAVGIAFGIMLVTSFPSIRRKIKR